MTQYDDTNRGALFKNDKKETDKHPDYKGPMNFNGEDGYLSAWLRESKDGKKYMSLSWSRKGEFGEKAQDAGYTEAGNPPRDEIPF